MENVNVPSSLDLAPEMVLTIIIASHNATSLDNYGDLLRLPLNTSSPYA